MRIYLWAEHTSRYPANTGIQRVTRGLARALQESGAEVVPVDILEDRSGFRTLTEAEVGHLARWNGPEPRALGRDLGDPAGHWFLVPELVSDPARPSLADILSLARGQGLLTAVVFYDAIPCKLSRLYPAEATAAHAKYMRGLAEADVVFPISSASGEDLKAFWYSAGLMRSDRSSAVIHPCLLPGEFSERPRVRAVASHAGEPIRVLSVSTVEPRKNHQRLVESFRLAAGKTPRDVLEMVLVGGCPFPALQSELEAAIAKPGPGRIRWVRNADDAALSRLYDECDFTVYSSYEEGFGLPILESLWHARPVVCHNGGAIAETAAIGGCVTVDVNSVEDLADAIARLAADQDLRKRLGEEAVGLPIKTWRDYGGEILGHLETFQAPVKRSAEVLKPPRFPRPLLSICVTTYNRARWLAHSLPLILEQTKPYDDLIEVVVCDNASTDDTGEAVRRLGRYAHLHYHRNEENVGMLGNLGVTSNHGRGRYIWVIGDDDLLVEGSIERILSAILRYPDTEMLYLNYAYTNFDKPEELDDAWSVIRGAKPVSVCFRDQAVPEIRSIACNTENCFTAIYCLIFREDHARKVYNQNTEGKPFSTLSTCVPTADYVCRHLLNRPGYWIGDPSVVVNLNVSWMRYAALFVLERFPELHDLMEQFGAPSAEVDRLRSMHLHHVMHWFEQIYFNPQQDNLAQFSVERLVRRYRHLPAFRRQWPGFLAIYEKAIAAGLSQAGSPLVEELERLFNENVGRSVLNSVPGRLIGA